MGSNHTAMNFMRSRAIPVRISQLLCDSTLVIVTSAQDNTGAVREATYDSDRNSTGSHAIL